MTHPGRKRMGQRRILVVHSKAERLAALTRELPGRVLIVPSVAEAWRVIETEKVDLVAAEDGVGVEFLEELSKRSPATPRVILLDSADRRPWLEAAAEGYRFAAIPEQSPNLSYRLKGLLPAEAESTQGLSGCTVEAAAAGGRMLLRGPLLRLTNESLTMRLEPGDGLEYFLPGREIPSVAVWRGREVILDGCSAAVSGLVPDHTGGFELEMALAVTPVLPPAENVVRDPLLRASLIGEALRRGRLAMEGAEGSPPRAIVRGRVDALAELILLEGLPEEFTEGTAVRLSFDAGGAHYRFLSVLAAPTVQTAKPALAAAIPSELRERRRRRARIALGAEGAAAEIAPATGAGVARRPAIDVELEGLGFLADPADLLPVGTRLRSVRVSLGDGPALQASGRIASRAPAQDGGRPAVRCGVHFDPLAREDQAVLAAAILRHAHPGLELARDLTFDALWCFLRDTGFLYPEKEEKLRPVLNEVRQTLATLLASPDGPLRTVVFRSGGLLAGHISALRAYRSTFMVQHLAVSKDGPGRLAAAWALNAGGMDYLEQLPDSEWVRVWFRPNNRWPARTFGRFARLQFDPHHCDLRTYSYLMAPTARARVPQTCGISIAPARPADWAEFRRHLVAAGQTAALAAEDLCSGPELTEAGESFRAIGLERRREALVARRGRELAGFSLLEFTSLGANFSHLTNAFRLHVVDRDPTVTAALAYQSRERYAELGRAIAVGLCESPDLRAWAEAGFSELKEYSCWTMHRSLMRRYVDFIRRLYERIPHRGAQAQA